MDLFKWDIPNEPQRSLEQASPRPVWKNKVYYEVHFPKHVYKKELFILRNATYFSAKVFERQKTTFLKQKQNL